MFMPSNNNLLISVISVLDNDAAIVADFVRETSQILSANYAYYEFLLIDNGSRDGTEAVVQDLLRTIPNLRLLCLSRSHSTEIALTAGLENCLGDYVVVLDAHSDPPTAIPTMIEHALDGYDVVIAERTERADQSWWRERCAVIYYQLASKMLGLRLQPNATHFRVLSRQVVNSITRIGNKSRYLKYLNALIGYRQTHVPYQPRLSSSKRGRGFWRAVLEGLDILISNSPLPLRIASLMGFLSSGVSLLYFGYVLVVTLVKSRIAEGWITTNLMLSALFFLLFLILTILSEYVARILEESKDRPLYFIAYETGSLVSTFNNQEVKNSVNVV
jgi:dolichol-phosphate mannosyltransferase